MPGSNRWPLWSLAAAVPFLVAATLPLAEKTDAPSGIRRVESWQDVAKRYLIFREQVAPIVLPAGRELPRNAAFIPALLAKWQNEPDWYCSFEDGVWYYPDKGAFGARLRPGMRVAVAEDAAQGEILVYVDAADGKSPPVEVAAFRAPPLPFDSAADRWPEVNARRVVLRAVLQPESAAPEGVQAIREQPLLFALTEGGGGAMRPASADTNIVLFDIRPDTNGMRIAIGYPTGFTNGLDLFRSDDLNGARWNLAATNVSTIGVNELEWLDESALERHEPRRPVAPSRPDPRILHQWDGSLGPLFAHRDSAPGYGCRIPHHRRQRGLRHERRA